MFIRDDLASHNGVKTFFFGRFDEGDQAVEAVGVGEGKAVHALLSGGVAELFKGGHAPSWGVVGVDVEMNKDAHASLRYTAHGTRSKYTKTMTREESLPCAVRRVPCTFFMLFCRTG